MKNIKLITTIVLLTIGFTVFTKARDNAKKNAADLNFYVDLVENLTPDYVSENWVVIDNGYNSIALRAKKNASTLSIVEKAKADESKLKYDALKVSHELNIKRLDDMKTKYIPSSSKYVVN